MRKSRFWNSHLILTLILAIHGQLQNQVTQVVQLLFSHPEKFIQLTESQLPVSMLFQLQISTVFLQITMNHRNTTTWYSLLILNNHQDPCQLVTTSTSKDFEGRTLYPWINLACKWITTDTNLTFKNQWIMKMAHALFQH